MKSKINGFITLVMVLFGHFVFAQVKTVSGIVTDQSGLPLPGVSVLEKGTSNGTQTDFDGNYRLETKQGATLVFSYVSMVTQEVIVTSNSINVSLKEDVQELEGVVVTALGIKREKKALGYATTTVDKEQITNVVNNNPLESLSGKIAGVDISAPAQPGASTRVIIRGIGSITQSNDPLYIVDGTPLLNNSSSNGSIERSYDSGSGINALDPNNIEDITVLRGAAATALYGSRAANGVFIITTKKGKDESKINVDFVSTTDFSEVARVPHLQNEFGQGWNGEGYSNGGTTVSNENGSWGPKFNGDLRPWGTIYNNSQQVKPYVALENNVRDFFTRGNTTTNSVNISKGGKNSDFSLAFTNLNSDGIIPTKADEYIKRTLGFNGGIKNDKFSLRAAINYSNIDQNAVAAGQGDQASEGTTMMEELLQIPRDISIVDLADYTNNPFNSPSYYFTPYAGNPYFALNENGIKIKSNTIYGNINLSYNLAKDLTASWQIGGNVQNERIKSWGAVMRFEEGSPNYGNTETVGGVTENQIQRTQFDTFFNLNYNKDLSEKFNLNILGGFNYNQRESDFLGQSITNLDIPNYYEISNSASFPNLTQANSLRKTLGFYGQAELGYISRFFLTLSSRYDISSTLPIENNKYFYPAASLSAVVLQNNSTFLKLRAAISQVANDANPYQTTASLVQGNANAYFGNISAPFGGLNYFEYGGRISNPELKPERTTETEFGVEGNLFNKRITFDVSLYHRKTEDLIIDQPVDPSTGFQTIAGNFADLVNKGIEASLSFIPVQNDNFSWTVNYTFTKNDNEVTRTAEGLDQVLLSNPYGINIVATEGKPIGSFYGEAPKMTADGQYIVDPTTGYYETEQNQYLGNGQRDFVMGLQNMFTYKNFSMNFAFDWKEGGLMYSNTKRLSHFTGNGIETTYNDRNPFIVPNSVNEVTDTSGNVTGYVENTTPIEYGLITDFYATNKNPGIERTHLIDKTFIRLRDLNFTYNLPSKIVDRLGLNKISLGVYGKNLFLWTPGDNPYIDPEVSTYGQGIVSDFAEFRSNPAQRSFGGFLKLSF